MEKRNFKVEAIEVKRWYKYEGDMVWTWTTTK